MLKTFNSTSFSFNKSDENDHCAYFVFKRNHKLLPSSGLTVRLAQKLKISIILNSPEHQWIQCPNIKVSISEY